MCYVDIPQSHKEALVGSAPLCAHNRPFSTPGSTGLYCPQVDSLVSHWWNERQNYKYAVFCFSTNSTQQVSTLKCQCHLEWDWSVLIWVSFDSIHWYYSQKWVVSTLLQNYGTYIRPGKLHLSFHIGAHIQPNISPQVAILYFSCSILVAIHPDGHCDYQLPEYKL